MSPLNDNPASFSNNQFQNGFSHSRGQPTIKFSIPAQDLLLDTTSLFLSGQVIFQNPTPAIIQTTEAAKANYNNQNNANVTDNTQTNYNGWNGISSVIDKVVIQSKKTNQELASIINYSQYDALKTGYSYNEEEYRQVPLMRNLAGGANHGNICRHLVNSAEITNAAATAGNQSLFGSSNQNDKFYGQFFSIPIDVALLQNQALHLGNGFVGGLVLTLHLNNESSVFFSRHRNIDTAQQTNGDLTGSTYTLKNLKLEGKYLTPTPQDLSSYNPNILLNSRQNLINDIVSSENSSTYTPQLQMVKGIVNLYQDDNQINNFDMNQFSFRRPMGMIEYAQAKNNVRFPQDFSVKTLPNPESITENTSAGQGNFTARVARTGSVNALNRHMAGMLVADPEMRLLFMKSLMGRKVEHHSATLELSKDSIVADYNSEIAAGAAGTGINVNADLMGVGADFTNGIGMVQNFVNQDYELRVKSAVNSGQADQPTDRSNRIEVQETFIRNFSQMNLNTLQKSM